MAGIASIWVPLILSHLLVGSQGCTFEVAFQHAPWLNGKYRPSVRPELQVENTRRPVYVSLDGRTMIHHWSDATSGDANWVVAPADSEHANSNGGWLSISTWSVTPQASVWSSPLSSWLANTRNTGGNWERDATTIQCVTTDYTIWLNVGVGYQTKGLPNLSGYYVDAGYTVKGWPALRLVSVLCDMSTELPIWLIRKRFGPTSTGRASQWIIEQGRYPGNPANRVLLSSTKIPEPYRTLLCGSEATQGYSKWSADTQHVLVEAYCESSPGAIHKSLRQSRTDPGWRNLNNGMSIPMIGLGTGAFRRDEVESSVQDALYEGYKLLDSATAYNNEEIIGKILHKSRENAIGIKRADILVASKLWYSELGYAQSLAAMLASMNRLLTTYIDLEFLHWPKCYDHIDWMDCSEASDGTWQTSWRALEQLYCEGTIRSLGVSNFDIKLLQELHRLARTPPQVLQNHATPSWPADDELKYCADHDILFQAYSSLRGFLTQASPKRGAVREIAKIEKRSEAEVALKWLLDRGIAVIPRSAKSEHRLANLKLFSFEFSPDSRSRLGGDKVSTAHDGDL